MFRYSQTRWHLMILIIIPAVFLSLSNSHTNQTSSTPLQSAPLLPIPFVSGCNVEPNDSKTGYVVFCNKFSYNDSSLSVPIRTQRLHISQVKNLITDVPICSHLQYLEVLELPRNHLIDISKEMLLGLGNLRIINLSNNFLRSLPEDSFIYNKKLEAIDLSANFLLNLNLATRAMGELHSLEKLNMSQDKLVEMITCNSLSSLSNSNFQRLDLSDCLITKLEKYSFLSVKNLTHLNLSDNPFSQAAVVNLAFSVGPNNGLGNIRDFRLNRLRYIRFLPLSLFEGLNGSNIENFELAGNTLFFSFFNSYLYYPKLERLDLSSCCKDFSEYFNFRMNMPSLKTFILEEVELGEIKTQFLLLFNLRTLILSGPSNRDSRIPSISENCFRNLHKLEKLQLIALAISQPLTKGFFLGLENLLELNMRSNLIKIIEDFAFENMESLDILDLSFNKIKFLTNNTFYGLSNITRLDLKANNIAFFKSSSPFQHMHRLQVLHLIRNKLVQLPHGIFGELYDAEVIRLDYNFIIPWQERLLHKTGNLTAFTIFSNKLTYFTSAMLEDVKQVKHLDFGKNALNCSFCESQDLQTWLKDQNFTVVYKLDSNDSTYYHCHYPASLEEQSIMTANLSINSHCFPQYIDVLMILYCICFPILGIIVLAILIWYRWKWNVIRFRFRPRLSVKKYKQQTYADDYEFDALIVYCEADRTWVWKHLVPELEMADPNFKLCLPERNILGGFSDITTIWPAIKNSRTTVLILSNKAMESGWCEFAMNMAQSQLLEENRSGLILVLLQNLEESLKTKTLKYILKTRTAIVFPDNPVGQNLFWERLHLAISKLDEKILSKRFT